MRQVVVEILTQPGVPPLGSNKRKGYVTNQLVKMAGTNPKTGKPYDIRTAQRWITEAGQKRAQGVYTRGPLKGQAKRPPAWPELSRNAEEMRARRTLSQDVRDAVRLLNDYNRNGANVQVLDGWFETSRVRPFLEHRVIRDTIILPDYRDLREDQLWQPFCEAWLEGALEEAATYWGLAFFRALGFTPSDHWTIMDVNKLEMIVEGGASNAA